MPPKWILPDGSFEDHALLLVDVSVTNDNASLKSGIDKFEKEIDPYLFPADGLLFLHNGSRKQPREKANSCSIDYFSLKRSDLDYAFSFQLSPGETVNFTIGFVLGKPGLFDTADGLYGPDGNASGGIRHGKLRSFRIEQVVPKRAFFHGAADRACLFRNQSSGKHSTGSGAETAEFGSSGVGDGDQPQLYGIFSIYQLDCAALNGQRKYAVLPDPSDPVCDPVWVVLLLGQENRILSSGYYPNG